MKPVLYQLLRGLYLDNPTEFMKALISLKIEHNIGLDFYVVMKASESSEREL